VVQTSGNAIVEQLHTMKRRMEVLFSESFKAEQGEKDLPDSGVEPELWEPSVDIWEAPDLWLLIADLPGVADEDLHVELAEKQLTIRGKRKTSPGREEIKAAQLERPVGSFSRTFILPGDAQVESVKAEFKHGVLTVAVSRDIESPITAQKVQVVVK
jgi:HSP20 family protein